MNRVTNPIAAAFRILALLTFGALITAATCQMVLAQTPTPSPLWTQNGANINNTNTGNVGIGTANPLDKLHINGNVVNGGGITIDNSGAARYRIGSLGTTVPNWGGQFINAKYNQAAGNWTLDDPTLNAGFLKLDVRNLSFGNEVGVYRMTAGSNPRPDSGWTPVVQFKLDTGNVYLVPSGGNVGLGTSTPAYRLDVQSSSNIIARFASTSPAHNHVLINAPSGYNSNLTLQQNGIPQWSLGNRAANNRFSLIEATGITEVFSILQNGNVGIGTVDPTAKLQVVGDLNVSGTVIGGNIVAKYQDVAEWVESSQALPPGTVVVLDQTKSNQVIASSLAYDTRVAGVISAQPGISLGERSERKVLVATTGRVRLKVDATKIPIRVGDLLVTSNVEGMAMRSLPLDLGGTPIHRPGTLIGKALEPLEKGLGEILVLLSLQ